jgi:two-component system response regulator (stage 0 sporulation protein A)
MRPIEPAVLLKRILLFYEGSGPVTNSHFASKKQIERAVADLLKELGVSPHLMGYTFILDAVCLLCTASDVTQIQMMTDIYPEVARKNSVQPSIVERGIRHAITSAWTLANISNLQAHFGYTIDARKDIPSNSAYIHTIASQIRTSLQLIPSLPEGN